jgi:uncharacterized protein (DUF1697 family)
MAAYVALLRGINVGGRHSLPMADLSAEFTKLGCENVRTYIQSGNVVFGFSGSTKDLASKISTAIETGFGFKPTVLILSGKVFSAIVAANPFAGKRVDPKHLHVNFLSAPATRPKTDRMQDMQAATERFELTDTAFYLLAPDGIGRSKLAANVESCLGVAATGRNWRTVGKIGEMLVLVVN